jgi:hypothetical protein
VIHISPAGPSLLPRIFSRSTGLKVAPEIKHGDPIKPGRMLEEKATLLQRMSERARKQKHRLTAQEFKKKFRELEPSVKVLHSLLLKASD